MPLNLAFLPTAVAGTIQDGILEAKLYESLMPMLKWRGLCSQERHPGKIGERVTKTRDGLIQPDTAASARRTAGQDPGTVTRSLEQFSYQIAPFGKGLDIHLPASFLAQASRFLSDTGALAFHAAQTMGRVCRDAILAAYGGGDTFTTNEPAAVTSVAVKDCTGFDTVMVNGKPEPVSVSNTLAITINGTAKLVSACVADDASSPPTGPGVLTITVAMDYAQNDRVLRTDAPRIVRQGSRATDQLIVAGDTPTIATFREAVAYMRTHNVPGIDGVVGGMYGVFVDPHVENALFADAEFHDAIQSKGIEGPFSELAIGDYAGMRFIRNTEMPVLADDADYQAHIHRSLVFGGDVAVEAFIPEADFQNEVIPEGIATANHYKTALDDKGVMTMVIRAPLDRAGEVVSASWLANADYCVPTDSKALTGTQRVKRAVLVHTAGPAA